MRAYRWSIRTAALTLVLACAGATAPPRAGTITRLGSPQQGGVWLPLHRGGRQVVATAVPASARRQWPGSYFEGRFRGPAVDLAIGPGEVALAIRIDALPPTRLVRPAPGLYRVAAGSPVRPHRIRVDVVSESQAGSTVFVGIRAPSGTRPLAPPAPRRRQIEFIGDSHTVGYGNASRTRDCSTDEVWRTTDTRRGLPGELSRRYDADYQVNAISGRGMVRNYDGFAAATLPQAYPYALLDGGTPDRTTGWHPDIVVIGLGTNDFSTPLKPGERWPTRAALHADYEDTYAAFVNGLRRRHPRALIVVWATDMADGEIAAEARRVVDRLRTSGDRRAAFAVVEGLGFGGCHAHPDQADDRRIADALARAIDGHRHALRRPKMISMRPRRR